MLVECEGTVNEEHHVAIHLCIAQTIMTTNVRTILFGDEKCAGYGGGTVPPIESKSAINWLQSKPLGALVVALLSPSWLTTV